MTHQLKPLLNNMTNKPGVYQMYNAQGKLIYVGKARNLKKRLASYFRKNLDSVKTKALMSQVVEIKTTITANDNEALLLEANLIKQYRPRYNVLLRDDKSYPYLYLSTQEKFPRLDFYRGARRKNGRYFGPYPTASAVRENLALIQKLFRVRQCRDSFFANRTRPCLQYQIKRCTAPCVGYVSEQQYQQQIKYTTLFLEGRNDQILKELATKMEDASEKKNYEEAAFYRDRIAQLRQLQNKQVSKSEAGNIDIIGLAELSNKYAVSILFIRAGRNIGKKVFFPNVPLNTAKEEVLNAFITQYYLESIHHVEKLDRLVLSSKLIDKTWCEAALQEYFGKKFHIIERQLVTYKKWCQMADYNALYALSQRLADKQGAAQKLQLLQKQLHFLDAIKRIECFDISHTQGEATIGSCVVYGEEGALNKDYRRFNIKNVTAGDDYAAMRQVLMRRYTRLKKEGAVLPDLIIIDGGKGQLKQAIEVLDELQLNDIFLISVAKGVSRKPGLEKIWVAGREHPVQLPPDSPALHLIQYVRDESHRFAITAHRQQRGKQRTQSVLEGIPGIGAKRRREILNYFGGMQELINASVLEIARVPGISDKYAQIIYDTLHGD